jgi:hypothetical protein
MDFQWQPRNDLAIDLGYVGNLGRHQVIPVPFNQPNIASQSSPTLAGGPYAQTYSYGYTVEGPAGCSSGSCSPINLPNNQPYLQNYEGSLHRLRSRVHLL